MEDQTSLRSTASGGRAAQGFARGLPDRLRRALLGRRWSKAPEPRVRFGQPVLPGLAALRVDAAAAAAPLVERAADVCHGRFTHLGTTREMPEKGVDWAARDASPAWGVALHALDELYALGVATAVAVDADRRTWTDAALTHLRDWVAHGRRVAASRDLGTHARRVVRLVEATAFFAPELRASPASRRLVLEALWADAAALAADVARGGAGLALVRAARALLVAGRYFDGMEARGWADQGVELLWTQLREQVHDDGGHRGHDPAVHAAVLAEYLEAIAVQQAANDEVPPWCRKRVKAMVDFLSRVTHPDGALAFGGGIAVEGVPPVRELLAVAAVLLHEPAFATAGDLPGVWPLLCLGESGRRTYAALPRVAPPPAPRALRRTGYYVLPGVPGDVMLVDGAPGFAFELTLGGRQLLVGPGAGVDPSHPLAQHLSSARARNVVVGVDGDALVPAGDGETSWTMRDGLVSFVGTVPLAGERRHRRVVVAKPGRFWLVCDQLAGPGRFTGELLVHLHPDAVVEGRCSGALPMLAFGRGDAHTVAFAAAGTDALQVAAGVAGPAPLGWHAVAVGDVRPAPTITIPVRGPLPLATGYLLAPDVHGALALELAHDAFELRVRLRVGDEAYALAVVQDEVELVTRG